MERPDDILFSGAKIGKDVPAAERRERERAKRERQKARTDKPPRPTPPPAQTDGQRREEQRSGTINPYQQRNNLFGTGDTRRARAQRRRDRMAARRESRDAFASRQAAEAARAAAPTGGRSLRTKPRRPRRDS